MHGPPPHFPPRLSAALRRLILGGAVVLALFAWSAAKTTPAAAQDTKPPAAAAVPAAPAPPSASTDPAKAAAGTDASRTVEILVGAKADAGAAKAAPDTPGAAVAAPQAGPAQRTVTVKKGGKTVTVTGVPGDQEFDSFGAMVHTEPALAGMIVGIVAIVFFAPVLAIALVIGYRMRKARMQNETMLKLAERGIVSPPDAPATIAGSQSAPAMAAAGATAKALRARAAWSDMRKGVVMTAIGLALVVFSILDDRTPNSVGLVLLFLGIGYFALWWFEQRQIGSAGGGIPPGQGTGNGGDAA